jgi:tetratricopeptide (TPR) repeat protein
MKYIIVLFALVLMYSCSAAQGNIKLEEAFKNKDWKSAIMLLKETTQTQPQNAIAWLQLGTAYLYSNRVEEANKAYLKANEYNIPIFITDFQKAKVYGDMGNVEQSTRWLSSAVDTGYSDLNKINNEQSLEQVRATPEFKEILDRLDHRVNPCRYDERHQDFNFWIGEWIVFDHKQGFKIGTSKIEKQVGDCAIIENWSDTQSIGKSINYYDKSIRKWKQNWVSQTGGIVWYVGEIKDGKMEYEGERLQPNGKIVKTRVTLAPQPDGNVRQTASDFIDGSWVVNFDADYRKM